MRISLLRSPTMPDPEADQGEHHFAYSLLPHKGRWNEATIAAAYGLNDPVLVFRGQAETGTPGKGVADASFISVDQANVVLETIKRAENGRDVIVRLYESQRRRGPVTLRTGFTLADAWRTNLLEEEQVALAVTQHTVTFNIRPYEIVTLRLAVAP